MNAQMHFLVDFRLVNLIQVEHGLTRIGVIELLKLIPHEISDALPGAITPG